VNKSISTVLSGAVAWHLMFVVQIGLVYTQGIITRGIADSLVTAVLLMGGVALLPLAFTVGLSNALGKPLEPHVQNFVEVCRGFTALARLCAVMLLVSTVLLALPTGRWPV
jgi:hypothetical protein